MLGPQEAHCPRCLPTSPTGKSHAGWIDSADTAVCMCVLGLGHRHSLSVATVLSLDIDSTAVLLQLQLRPLLFVV